MVDFKKIFEKRKPTEGGIIKNILSITWPLWFNSGIWVIFYGLNTYWVSRVGTEALAAVVAGGTCYMLMMAPIQGLVTAGYGLIGNLAGRGEWSNAGKLAQKILSTTWLFSFFIVFLGYFLAPVLLKFIGTKENVLSMAVVYLRIQVIGGIISFYLWVANDMIRATGEMMKPMAVMFLVIVLNTIFDWFLILGNFGFPRLEVTGAALASALSASIGAIVALAILFKGYSPIKINLKDWRYFKINIGTLKEIMTLAGFDSLEKISKVFIDLILLRFIAFWGTAALAIYAIGQRLLKMASMPGFDLAKTAAVMAANNLGAGKIGRTEKSVWLNAGINILIMGLTGLCFFIFAGEIINFYSKDACAIGVGINYLRITVFGYVFFAASIVLNRAFAGIKNTKIPAVISLLTLGVLQLTLAKCLPQVFGLGVLGIWWAILITMVVNGSALAIIFKLKIQQLKKTVSN